MTTINTLDVPVPFPIPAGRGRWRLTVHRRDFTDGAGVGGPYLAPGAAWGTTIIAELTQARGRRLIRERNKAATITFTLDGRDAAALLVTELQTDVYAWRWDEYTGRDVCAGRFVVDHAEDQISEQSHVVTFSGHDYLAMLERRRVTRPATGDVIIQNRTQDALAEYLVANFACTGESYMTGSSVLMLPGAFLPIFVVMVNPDGTARAAAGPTRNRTWQFGSEVFELLVQLSDVTSGFDFDVLPAPEVPAGLAGPSFGTIPANKDALRIFYPTQGTARTDLALVYGSNVSSLTRTVNSADYANRVWATGNKASTSPTAPQLFIDRYNTDAAANVVGEWIDVLNAPDVSDATHLAELAAGALDARGVLLPTYTLELRPGTYRQGYPNVGDVLPLVVQSGRLNVNTALQVMALDYDVGEDGDENVKLTVGRPPPSFGRIFRDTRQTVNALTRR